MKRKVSPGRDPSEAVITHLLLNVIKGVGRVDSEADQDDMGVRVGERTETVIVLLTSGIPKSKLDVLSVDLDIGDVVLEDSGDVHLRLSVESAWGYNATLMFIISSRDCYQDQEGPERGLTSGKVPLEKTLPDTRHQFTAHRFLLLRL